MKQILFCIGLFITLTMLNCWWFLQMAKKLDSEYSNQAGLFLDAGTLALGITLMYYAVLS